MSALILGLAFLPNWLIWRIYKLKIFDPLTLTCIASAYIIWYSVPGILAAFYRQKTPFSPFYLLRSNSSTESWFTDFTLVYAMESFAIFLALAIILTFSSKNNKRKKSIDIINQPGFIKSKIRENHKLFILVIATIALIYQAFNFQGSYLENNNAEVYGNSGLAGQIITGFIYPLSCVMNILITLKERNRKILTIAFGLLVISGILFASRGARFGILLPIVVYIFRRVLHQEYDKSKVPNKIHLSKVNPLSKKQKKNRFWKNKRKLLITLCITGCFLFFVFLPLAQSLAEARQSDRIDWPEVISTAFLKSKSQNTSEDWFKKFAVEPIFGKLDSFTGGSLIVSEVGYAQAGFTPYIGSALLFLPRSIFPDRPIAGTSDGTIFTHPSRIVPQSLGLNSASLNIPISPLHIAFWHFGYIGLPVFVIALVLYFKLLDVFLSSSRFIFNSMGLFSMSIPMFSTIIISPDAVLKNSLVLLVFIIVYKFFRFILPRKIASYHPAKF